MNGAKSILIGLFVFLASCHSMSYQTNRAEKSISAIEQNIIRANDLDTSKNEYYFIHLEYIFVEDRDTTLSLDSSYVIQYAKRSNVLKGKPKKAILTAVMVNGRLSGVCSEDNGYKIIGNQLFYDATKSLMKHLCAKKINYAFSLCTNRNIPNRYIHFFFDKEALMLSLYDGPRECIILPIDSALKYHTTEIKQNFFQYW